MGINLPGKNFDDAVDRMRFNVCKIHALPVCTQCRADRMASVHQHPYNSTQDLIGNMTDQYFEYDVMCHMLESIVKMRIRSYQIALHKDPSVAAKLENAKHPTAFQLFEMLESIMRPYLGFPSVRTVMVLDNRTRCFAPRIPVAKERNARKTPTGHIPAYTVDTDTMLINDTQRILASHVTSGNGQLRVFLMTRLSQKYGIICVSDTNVIGGSATEQAELEALYRDCSEGDIMMARLACSGPDKAMYGLRIVLHTVDSDVLALAAGVLPPTKTAYWIRPIPRKKRKPPIKNYDAAVLDLQQWAWRVRHTGENPLQRHFLTMFYRATDYGNPLDLGQTGCKLWSVLHTTEFIYFKDATRQTVVLDRNELARAMIRFYHFGPLLLEQLYRSLFMLLYYIGFRVDPAAFGWLADGSYRLPPGTMFDAYMLSFTTATIDMVYFDRDG